jgi:DNA-directed RNA polymerase specialized sigma24 family protein
VIAKALVAVRHEVAESVRRVKSARADRSGPMPQGWTLRPDTTKAEVEEALLDLDVFPRATVLLLIFERVPIADAATLLDADTALVKKAQAIGLGEFSSNLAHRQRPTAPASPSLVFA